MNFLFKKEDEYLKNKILYKLKERERLMNKEMILSNFNEDF